jgi:hypothetical protein
MKRLAIAAVALVVAVACGFVAPACKENEVTLSENMKEVRADPTMQANLQERRSIWEDCVKDEGKVACLARFAVWQEEDLAACLDLYDDKDHELCRLELEVIAEDHGWSIPRSERTTALQRSPETLDWEKSCIVEVDKFNCFTRHSVYREEAFKACDDIWGGDACKDVLGDLMAGLEFEVKEGDAKSDEADAQGTKGAAATPRSGSQPVTVLVTNEAYLSAAALRDEELPEGYVLEHVEYDDSRPEYRADWISEGPLISSVISYHESPSAAQAFIQGMVDSLREEGGYSIETASKLEAQVAVHCTEGGCLVATHFATGRLAGGVVVAEAEEPNVVQLRDLCESMAAIIVERIDDLPVPGEYVELPRDNLDFKKAVFDMGTHARDLLFQLQQRADGKEDIVADAFLNVLVDCEVTRTARYFEGWVLIAPSCTRYMKVLDLADEGSLGQTIEDVAEANRLLDQQLELIR